eukprot:5553801-Alexandrium_andersonii.AAC.1
MGAQGKRCVAVRCWAMAPQPRGPLRIAASLDQLAISSRSPRCRSPRRRHTRPSGAAPARLPRPALGTWVAGRG